VTRACQRRAAPLLHEAERLVAKLGNQLDHDARARAAVPAVVLCERQRHLVARLLLALLRLAARRVARRAQALGRLGARRVVCR
jgi:hypothetical protein